jgi:hypothetical protein
MLLAAQIYTFVKTHRATLQKEKCYCIKFNNLSERHQEIKRPNSICGPCFEWDLTKPLEKDISKITGEHKYGVHVK